MLRAHGSTNKGLIRSTNEDAFHIDESLGLCVVADGMGGHNAGEVASRMAVDTVLDYIRHLTPVESAPSDPRALRASAAEMLTAAIHLANIQILDAAGASPECAGMGTTIVAAVVHGERLTVAHVGDSRFYLFDGQRLRRLTDDDSWAASMLARDPQTDPALFEHHPLRHALTNVVGAHPRAEVHIVEETLRGGELMVLTTDGVHEPLAERRIEEMLTAGTDAVAMAGHLVATALSLGSRDNCTAVVARYLPD